MHLGFGEDTFCQAVADGGQSQSASHIEGQISDPVREAKQGKLKSGRSGQKVTSRKQAVAIGLSKARKEGDKVPKKKK